MDNIYDRKLINQNYKRWADNFKEADFLFEFSEIQICERLSLVNTKFNDIAIIGSRSCGIIEAYFSKENVSVFDIEENEILPFETSSYDLIISVMELHKINNLEQFLFQIKHSLRKNGLFLGVMAGGNTLKELKHSMLMAENELYGGVSARISPFLDMKSISNSMQMCGFSIPVVDNEIINIEYGIVSKLYQDLRFMGESNCLVNKKKKLSSKKLFQKTDNLYKQNYRCDDSRVKATFELIFLSGWNDD